MRILPKNNKGVSLIELMIVLVILAAGLIPIAAVQTRSNRDVFDSGQYTEALNIAQMQMERVRNLGFNNAVSDSGSVGNMDWWARVQPAGIRLNSIEVTVQWQEQGDTQQVQLSNLLSSR
jgi:prepilin-type N-terminal cleavage/methylation domain-containing protein